MYIVICVPGSVRQLTIIACLDAVACLACGNCQHPRNLQMPLTGLQSIKQDVDYSDSFPSEVFRKFSTLCVFSRWKVYKVLRNLNSSAVRDVRYCSLVDLHTALWRQRVIYLLNITYEKLLEYCLTNSNHWISASEDTLHMLYQAKCLADFIH